MGRLNSPTPFLSARIDVGMSDLQVELEDIDGVGEKTAEKIMAVLEDHDTPDDPLLAKAKTAAKDGNTHKAIVYLNRL